MQDLKVNVAVMQARPNRFITLLLIIPILFTIGVLLSIYFRSQSKSPVTITISQSTLEEKYGLRVNLLAVTGAGGFVDVRIKIVDDEKAKLLLSDKKNFPALLTDANIILSAPEDTKSQAIKFDNDGIMFIMYPNSANAVMRGTPVKILFGDIALDAINAK